MDKMDIQGLKYETVQEWFEFFTGNGWTHLCCEFSGGGDSGGIDSIWVINAPGYNDLAEYQPDTVDTEDEKALEYSWTGKVYWLFDELISQHFGSFDGDGGFGQIVIDMRNGNFFQHGNYYITNTETCNAEGQINEEE